MDYTTELKEGDFLRFQKGQIEARKIDLLKVTKGSGRHRIQRAKCENNCILYIDKPWKLKKK